MYNSFVVAPFWANFDSRQQGQVRYKIFRAGESSASDDILGLVSTFVSNQTDSSDYAGSWMLVATWEGIQEFKRGNPSMLPPVSFFFFLHHIIVAMWLDSA